MRKAIFLFLITLVAVTALADNHAVAVFDLSAADTDNLNTALFFQKPSQTVNDNVPLICTDPGAAFKALRGTNQATDRWISVKGSVVDIHVVYPNGVDTPTIKITEEPRETRLSTDFATLITVIKNVAGIPGIQPLNQPAFTCIHKTYTLTRTRATLTITVTYTVDGKDTSVDKTIITGPTEHLFLSTDIPVTKLKELKYDDSSKTVTTKDSPTAFYGGFDYILGDIQTNDQRRPWEGIVLKGMLKISKKPLDGYGFGIGYRSPNFSLFGMTFEMFSPFVGYFWTKYDDKDTAGNPITRSKNGIRFGVSFNLDKALELTKK
jgi:hypothetical protein